MNRTLPPLPASSSIFVEALEPRIAPAGLLNESKFTSIVVGGSVLLDASGGQNDFQGLTTGFGGASGSYLLYITTGKALVFTSDLNGDGKFEPGEITGISLGVDSLGRAPNLILFSDVNGDIVTNLLPGHGVNALTDSDNNPNNGRDGRVLLPTDIGSITLRTITDADIDTTIPGNTVDARLGLTSFAIHGNIYCGGNFGNSTGGGLLIDNSGSGALATKFNGGTGIQLYQGSTPQVGSIMTGSAASGQTFHFTQQAFNNIEGPIQTFGEPAGHQGGDIIGVRAASPGTIYSVGELITGTGGAGARGGNISDVVLHGATGSYELIAGDGGAGGVGGSGGDILNFNDLSSITGQVILHTGAGGTGALGAGGPGGTATFTTTSVAASVEVFLGNGGDGFSSGGNGAGLTNVVLSAPESTLPIGSKFAGTWHDIGDVGNTHPIYNADGTLSGYAAEAINFNDPSYFTDPALALRNGTGDHFGDGVFTTSTPGQIVVVFGDGQGGLNDNAGNFNISGSETVYLRVPGVVNPVMTVGDFNGDGRPDVAVASGDANNFAGVYIFLNQIGTPLDPINSHNFSRNPLGDHPFSDALQSAIPSLTNLELINGGTGLGEDFPIFTGPGAVLALTTGDYNGDGIADIGLMQQAHLINPPTNQLYSLVGVLFGDPAHDANGATLTHTYSNTVTGLGVTRNAGTGFFHANLAAVGAAPTLQFTLLGDGGAAPVLKTSSLTAFNEIGTGTTPNTLATGEVMLYAVPGQKMATIFSVSNIDPNTHQPIYPLQAELILPIGKVDTNRLLQVGTNQNITSVQATVQDIVLSDLDGDGNMDVVLLSKTPAQFLVTFSGDGAGIFTLRSSPGGAQNAGVFLAAGLDAPPPILSIVAVDLTGLAGVPDGIFDEFGFSQILPGPPPEPVVTEIGLGGVGGDPFYQSGAAVVVGSPVFLNQLPTGSPIADQTVNGLDAFYPIAPYTTASLDTLRPTTAYGLLSPDTTDVNYALLFILGDNFSFYSRYLTENGFFLDAGNGGNSTVGGGGNGGTLGLPTLTSTSAAGVSGAIQITFPQNIAYAGTAFLLGGNGGNGFAAGGNGGSVEGLTVRYAEGTTVLSSNALVIAGNGGNAIAGNGGLGGGVDHMSVQTGVYFASGNGGSGINGGAGGSIVGNGAGVFDTSSGNARLTQAQADALGYALPLIPAPLSNFDGVGLSAGRGGQGTSVGGLGGSITGWDSAFNPLIGASGSSLYYATGSGGSAVAGSGGNGGAIANSSPDTSNNNLAGDLHLQTGSGGAGLTGGDGGAIANFINQPTDQTAVPGLLSVVTGFGGAGLVGNGGIGGTINAFQSSATGLVTLPGDPLFGVGRVIAGDGGASFGGEGGAGGSITNIVAQTTSTPIVVAAGAGGAGLTVGGDGGAVMGTPSSHSIINSAAQQVGKVLIVAGAGGDASSALASQIALPNDPNTNDLAHALLAIGGVSARAGDGGNVTDITQPISTQTAVDIVAGNGGSVLNAGTSLDPVTGVGRGGSVVDIALTGTVGAVSRNATLGVPGNPPIQAYAYTDQFGVTTPLSITAIIDIVANQSTTPVFSLTDNATITGFGSISGNEGIVAGAAGRVRNNQPARDSINGSAQNITAQSIMSIVAGSVTSVAPVNVLSGITVTDPDGVLGVDRSPTAPFGANGRLDYFTPSGVDVTNLQPGYSLVNADGALFAITIQQTSGTVLQGPRVIPVFSTNG